MKRLAAIALVMFLPLAHAADPKVAKAWIREAPPNASALAGFVSLEGGSRDDALVSASSPDFGRVEIHEMSMQDGVMKMRALEALELPAGAHVTLAPGGEHLMLLEPKRALVAGDKVGVTLEFRRADPIEVVFEVAASAPGTPDPHAGH
jgi:hypothetical protein